MKKLVFASALALAGLCLVHTPALRAQDAGQISLPPEQFNAYQAATTQSDPAAKAAALESFLTAYPQTPVKNGVLDQLIDAYQQVNPSDPNKVLSAASRMLQIDPNNMKATYVSATTKKTQCAKSLDPSGAATDAATCDDAAALAQKGLALTKPAGMSDADWAKLTGGTFPIFHSIIAFDDAVSKKDFKGAIDEYTKELMLYSPDQCNKPGPCLADTLQLAQAYAKPGDSRNEIKAIWFYSRAWDFAPDAFKSQIEPPLEYWYKRYHGTLDGDAAIKQQIDAIKTQAQATLFPPTTFTIAPAPSAGDLADKAAAVSDDELKKLNLEDKEFILANGSKASSDKLWALLKGQQTPVPGNVIADQATVLKISVTLLASPKPKDFVVKLNTPGLCSSIPEPPSELKVKDAQAYVLANGVKADTDAMGDVLTDAPAKIHKFTVEPAVTSISVAVTQDAKDAKTADFNVNLKEPLPCKEAPAVGSVLGVQPAAELDATYDTFTQVPAAGTTPAAAQIVLGEGFVQPQKAAPAHHTPAKPSAAHHAQ